MGDWGSGTAGVKARAPGLEAGNGLLSIRSTEVCRGEKGSWGDRF